MSDANPARQIPEYPDMERPEDWGLALRLSKSMLERATIRQEQPSYEEFQATVHLIDVFAARHFRPLH